MRRLFFYGTLCHAPLLEAVLGVGHGALSERLKDATLPDHRVSWVKDRPYPMIEQALGYSAEGRVLADVSDEEETRLSYYEGAFAYKLVTIDVTTAEGVIPALCYYPMSQDQTRGPDWVLADWVHGWAEMAIGAAKDVMARRDKYDAETASALRPFLMARHWARKLAREGSPSTVRQKTAPGDVTVHERLVGYSGFFELAEFRFDHRRYDGTRSPAVTREAFLAFDAALVLPYDPATDTVLLIEQMRFGPLWREDPNPWVFEPIAGLVDAGENPEDTARREAVEEAGLTLGPLELMAKVYASPGYSTEFFHCYLAVTDLASHEPVTSGVVSEHEDIRSHVLSFEDVMALVKSGEINAGPLVMMLYWLAAERDRLRAAA